MALSNQQQLSASHARPKRAAETLLITDLEDSHQLLSSDAFTMRASGTFFTGVDAFPRASGKVDYDSRAAGRITFRSFILITATCFAGCLFSALLWNIQAMAEVKSDLAYLVAETLHTILKISTKS